MLVRDSICDTAIIARSFFVLELSVGGEGVEVGVEEGPELENFVPPCII